MAELLAQVKGRAPHPWIYPLFCLPPTPGPGGRRYCGRSSPTWTSPGTPCWCERRSGAEANGPPAACPLTPFLKEVLREWLAIHPGGPALFCHAGTVARSKKRSRTTGHQNEKKRPSSLKGRMATVKKREQAAQAALTRNEVHDHFKRVLAGTKWELMRGLHTLRHSFISACASKGVDQRLVQEWAGHMRRGHVEALPAPVSLDAAGGDQEGLREMKKSVLGDATLNVGVSFGTLWNVAFEYHFVVSQTTHNTCRDGASGLCRPAVSRRSRK